MYEIKLKNKYINAVNRIREESSADMQFPVLDENDAVSEADLLQLEGK